ncbi:MAG: permease [Bacteroides sp.]|nr:permease [Syntrophomonadaceae bacterium]MDD4055732.1 permease [Bacteroides sp.]MDD4549994.1 permease [Syntrophomonadaceae bacterium]
MNTFINTLKYFVVITAELTVLFVGISTIVALILLYLPEEKIRNWMLGRGIWGNFIGAFIGALTPFCACSTIPLTLGFLKAGITFGAVMSFVISSPLLNPIILAIMVVLMGWKVAIIYFIIVFFGAVFFGVILERSGGENLVKNVRITRGDNLEDEEIPKALMGKLKLSFRKALEDFKAVLIYLLVGVGIGAVIYGYLPQDLVLKFAGPDNPFAIPIAAVIGIPLYIRAEAAIPIGVALMQKGMSVGAVIALIIGGAGMAIPEMSMLASIFKGKLVAAIVAVIFVTAVMGGYIFNLVL